MGAPHKHPMLLMRAMVTNIIVVLPQIFKLNPNFFVMWNSNATHKVPPLGEKPRVYVGLKVSIIGPQN